MDVKEESSVDIPAAHLAKVSLVPAAPTDHKPDLIIIVMGFSVSNSIERRHRGPQKSTNNINNFKSTN